MTKKTSKQIKSEIKRFTASRKRAVTIEEVSEAVEISRPTAKKYMMELLKEGWLEEQK